MGLLGAALSIGAGIAGAISNANKSKQAGQAIAEANNRDFIAQTNFQNENARQRREFNQRRFEADRKARQDKRAIASSVGPELDPKLNRVHPLIATSVFGDLTEPNIGRRKFLSNVAKAPPTQIGVDKAIS